MSTRYLLVGNPTARSGKAAERIERALTAMRGRGWDVKFLSTEPDGGTVPLVTGACQAGVFDVIVYLGGDGTFAEVAKGILGAPEPVRMGMIPSGTANDMGKSYGIAADESALERNLEIIEAAYTTNLDVGRVENLGPGGEVSDTDLFFDCVGWGMSADILAIRNEDRQIVGSIPLLREVYRHQAVYAGAAISAFLNSWLEPTLFSAEVICDGETYTYEKLSDLVINGAPVYAGEWVLDRFGDPDDGVMELVPFQGRREMLSRAVLDFKNLPIWPDYLESIGVTHAKGFSGRDFELKLSRPGREDITAQIDGEEWIEGRHFRVIVVPGALPLIIDEDWVPPWKLS